MIVRLGSNVLGWEVEVRGITSGDERRKQSGLGQNKGEAITM